VKEGAAPKAARPVDIAIPMFGYKNHIGIDQRHGLIRTWVASAANAHDGARITVTVAITPKLFILCLALNRIAFQSQSVRDDQPCQIQVRAEHAKEQRSQRIASACSAPLREPEIANWRAPMFGG
jgi:hypothetical protein